jgi:hypothetical protein
MTVAAPEAERVGTLADLDRLSRRRVSLEERADAVLEKQESRNRRIEFVNIAREIGRARDRLRERDGEPPLLTFPTLAAKQRASSVWVDQYEELRTELRERFGAKV